MDKENKGTKKALNRKAKQVAMEATEHAQKAVVYADEDCKKITNSGLHDKLTKTHNNEFLQREQEKVGINIVEKEDIIKLNSAVKKRKGEYSPYNAVRFSEQEIDEINILNAVKKCMTLAVEKLSIKPDITLVDGNDTNLPINAEYIVKGDSKSYTIGCASILAKVFRDNLMTEYAKEFPEYGLEKHKGYGTKAHIEKIKEIGPCKLHRRTFIKNFWVEPEKN